MSCFSSDAFSGGSDMLGSSSVAPAAAASPRRSQSPRPLASRAPGAAASGRRGNRAAPTAVSKRRPGCPRAACQSPRPAPLLGPARRLRVVPASPFPRAAPASTPARSPSRALPRQAVGRAPKDPATRASKDPRSRPPALPAAGSSCRRRNHVRPLRGLGPRPRGVHPLNVYALPSKKLVALQLRSIFIKYKSKSFCEKLLSWVKCSGCTKVVVLSSSHSYHRNDLQLRSTPFRYLLTPSMQKSVQNKIQSLNWEEMEKTPCIPEIDDSEFCVRVPGGGITKLLYDEGCSKEIPIAILLKFVSEGDNIPDALGLVEYLNEWLQIIKPHCEDPTASSLPWKMPSSWRLLFGSGLPPALF
ncbi:proteasome assembly chaperone 2 isoform X1 [Bubalus bubalis]|uniref:proteasome assembly chaperone 2 isoform X1 n=1 Tax=Bubalus bubalis TaxID=89462 RepID=UPI001D10403C|nr:proteasome assembly chaperone 2 isoform X1 [Bubalus bubalis]